MLEEFLSKYGFEDGENIQDMDWEARTLIVTRCNQLFLKAKLKYVAIEFDRPGVHNPCLIVFCSLPEKLTRGQAVRWLSKRDRGFHRAAPNPGVWAKRYCLRSV